MGSGEMVSSLNFGCPLGWVLIAVPVSVPPHMLFVWPGTSSDLRKRPDSEYLEDSHKFRMRHPLTSADRYLENAMLFQWTREGFEIAKPMIAYEAKTSALVGLGNYDDALVLTDHLIELSRARKLRENLSEALEAKGDWTGAIQCYMEAVSLSQSVKHWHSSNDTDAALAKAYEHLGRFDEAMRAIDAAINANRQTPDEIYYAPRNLAIKAEIASKAGKRRQAEDLYRNGADMLEVLLQHVPAPSVERELMSELSDLYSGYFGLLASDDRLPEAFAVIERAHGRLEAEALWYDKLKPPQTESPQERVVNSLELQLLDAVDQKQRSALLSRIRC